MNKNEIIASSEANGFYNLLDEDEKRKIPQEFVYKMFKFSDKKIMEKIKDFEDINKKNISREGIKRIAYMSLFI
jgi:hypothetical protein